MIARGFHHVALQAIDVEGVAGFYQRHLGLPERARYHFADGRLRSIWLGVGQGAESGFIAIERLEAGATRGAQGLSMVALTIDAEDREALCLRLVASGVPIEKETGFTFYVRDPEGTLVGLSHHPTPRVSGVK